jgi:hypothetical protein
MTALDDAIRHAKAANPPLPIGKSPIVLPGGVMAIDEQGRIVGRAMRQCADPIHVFAEIPGRCQCGDQWWGEMFGEEQS